MAPLDDYSKKLESELGCEWYPLTMNNQGYSPVADLALFVQLWRYYRRIRPAVVLHFTIKNNIYGTWAARMLGIPAVNNVSGLGTAFIRSGMGAAIARRLYKASLPLSHHIFCQNPEDLQLLRDAKLVPPERVELIPGSGVDLEKFHPRLKKPHDGPVRFLYAGRMLADKGLHELIAAVRIINADKAECILWLAGFADVENVSSISMEQVRAWASEPGIEWLGASDAMEQVYAQVDCVVLPSYREGLPRSLLEAGAMGLPVVATDVPGCRQVVKDGWNGYLCEAQSSESLVGAMRKVLTMRESGRRDLGCNGRALVAESYGEQLVVRKTLLALDARR